MYERVERVSGTSNISTAPSAFSRPGQPETRQRPRQKRRFLRKPSPMPMGTPSNAMAASMPSWTRPTRRRRKRRPRPEQDGSTISASGGQARGAREAQFESHCQIAPANCADTPCISASLRGQSPRRCGVVVSGIPLQDKGFPASLLPEPAGGVPPASPFGPAEMVAHKRGESGGSDPFFGRWCGTGKGEVVRPLAHTISPPLSGGRSLHSDPCGKAVESAKKPTAKNSRPQMALRPREASLGDAHNPIAPIRSTGSLPLHLTASDSGLILG